MRNRIEAFLIGLPGAFKASGVVGLALSIAACQTLDSGACADPSTPTSCVAQAPLSAPSATFAEAHYEAERTARTAVGPRPDLFISEKPEAAAPAGLVAKPKARATALGLGDAIRQAMALSPQTGLAQALEQELAAGVDASRSAYLPRISAVAATGQATNANYSQTKLDYWDIKNASGAWRNDAILTGTQLIYDFGATKADVDRAVKARDAQSLRVMATAEEVALNASLAYLKVQEGRELLSLAKENLQALQGIATLISRSEQNGNGTQADLKRVQARVIDAESAVLDQDLELKLAIEKFRRLVQMEPDKLKLAPTLDAALPPTATQANAEAQQRSPQLLAGSATVAAARFEVDGLNKAEMPRLSVETEAGQKNFRGQNTRSELDVRGMLTLSYKLSDGGLSFAKREQASARITQAEMRLVADRQDVEAAIRQAYLQRASLRAKSEGLREGVASSAKARQLYREQFSGGKRTLLELLEVQASYYTAQSNAITNGYEQRRAAYSILKAVGRLGAAILKAA